jgi:hypothetical protein
VLARIALLPWFLQENLFPDLLGDVDRGLGDEGGKDFPETVLVHGDRDVVVSHEWAVKLTGAIGKL